jgi:hypothetical protein
MTVKVLCTTSYRWEDYETRIRAIFNVPKNTTTSDVVSDV